MLKGINHTPEHKPGQGHHSRDGETVQQRHRGDACVLISLQKQANHTRDQGVQDNEAGKVASCAGLKACAVAGIKACDRVCRLRGA
eukprot:1141136-Pelagomonas_calceolata.AAC.4